MNPASALRRSLEGWNTPPLRGEFAIRQDQIHHIPSWSVAAIAAFWSLTSHALVVNIDQFLVTRNAASFTDTFSNNQTPSQETSTYFVTGSFPNGAESGGTLTLNSDWGNLTTNAVRQPRRALVTTLLSNVNPNVPNMGLTQSDTIGVTGTFNLVTPLGPLANGYGVRVLDVVAGQSAPDRLVELDVQYNANFGGTVIRYLLQDFANNAVTTLGFVPFVPPSGADQIELFISRPNTANNDFIGAYAFGTGGAFDPFTPFARPGTLFTNTRFVRAQFIDFTAVPEPGSLALLGLGLAGLAASRRRKQ